MMKKAILILVAAGAWWRLDAAAQAPTFTERVDLQRYFDAAGTSGAIVVRRLRDGSTTVVNLGRAQTGYTPASTFKILNSLLALDAGVVRDVDRQIFKYNGQPFLVDGKPFLPPACNGDINLRTAFTYSCIPVYQDIARRLGLARYRAAIRDLGYGNAVLDQAPADAFWLEGGYHATAFQQVEFLARLARGDLPFSKSAMETTRELMLVEQTSEYVLRGKTGYLFSTRPAIGWFVGWLESEGELHVFALNLDLNGPEHGRARIPLAVQLVKEMKTP